MEPGVGGEPVVIGGVGTEVPSGGGGANCVAATVEAGSDVGDNVGLALGLSPPHAARINTRVRIMPDMDNPGKHRAADDRFKTRSPYLYDLGVAVESSNLSPY